MPLPLLPLLLALVQAAPGTPPADVAPAPAPVTAAPATPAPAPTPVVAPASAPAPDVAPASAPTPVQVAPLPAPVQVTAQEPAKPPREVGPFFVEEPPAETRFAGGPQRGDPPRLSLGRGKFCFVEDAACKLSLIATADVGIGVNVTRGSDFSYAQFNFRGGLVLRPLALGTGGGWHPWGIGAAAGWSQGTGNPGKEGDNVTTRTPAFRVFIVNQLWLSQKRNAFHLDVDFGIVRSPVPAAGGNYLPAFGTHAGVSANWGGWGGLFVAGDFLYQDTRVVFGLRGHGIAAGPAIGLLLLGLLAGGAFQ